MVVYVYVGGGSGGASLRRLPSPGWQEKIFSVSVHTSEGPSRPRGAPGVVKSNAQLAARIIHSLHLLFSTSHFSSLYSRPFSLKAQVTWLGVLRPPVSVLPSASSRWETPSPSDWIGQPVLTHHCAECLRTCFTRWLGLVCVITFEWGLGAGRLPCWSCVVFSKWELQARKLLCFWKKRRNSFSAATRKAVFSGKVKDIECFSLSLSLSQHSFEWNASTAHLSKPVVTILSMLLLYGGQITVSIARCLAVFTELTLPMPCSWRCS